MYPHFICPSVSLIHALCYFNIGKIIMLRFFDNCSFALLMLPNIFVTSDSNREYISMTTSEFVSIVTYFTE